VPNLVSVTTAGRGCEQFWTLGYGMSMTPRNLSLDLMCYRAKFDSSAAMSPGVKSLTRNFAPKVWGLVPWVVGSSKCTHYLFGISVNLPWKFHHTAWTF